MNPSKSILAVVLLFGVLIQGCATSLNWWHHFIDYKMSPETSSISRDKQAVTIDYKPIPVLGIGQLHLKNSSKDQVVINLKSLGVNWNGQKINIYTSSSDPLLTIAQTTSSSSKSGYSSQWSRITRSIPFSTGPGLINDELSSELSNSSSYTETRSNPESIYLSPGKGYVLEVKDPVEEYFLSRLRDTRLKLDSVRFKYSCPAKVSFFNGKDCLPEDLHSIERCNQRFLSAYPGYKQCLTGVADIIEDYLKFVSRVSDGIFMEFEVQSSDPAGKKWYLSQTGYRVSNALYILQEQHHKDPVQTAVKVIPSHRGMGLNEFELEIFKIAQRKLTPP